MKVQINRGQVDKLINEMDLFPTVKEEKAKYEQEVATLLQQENELKERLSKLQLDLTKNLMDRELTGDIGKQVNLNIVGRQINIEVDVVTSMLEELTERQLELKFRYTDIFKDALAKDYPQVMKYDAVSLIEHMRYETLSCLADVSNKMLDQFNEVAGTVFEVFETPEVMEKYPALQYAFYRGRYVPHFESANPVVISKADVFSAVEAGTVLHPNPEDKNNGK